MVLLHRVVGPLLLKMKMCVLFGPATLLLGIYPPEILDTNAKNTYKQRALTGAGFAIAKIWKPPQHPFKGGWLNTSRYRQTMGYHAAMTKEVPSPDKKGCEAYRLGGKSKLQSKKSYL